MSYLTSIIEDKMFKREPNNDGWLYFCNKWFCKVRIVSDAATKEKIISFNRRNIYQAPESDLGKTQKKTNTVVDIFRWLALVPAVLLSWFVLFSVGGTFAMEYGALDKDRGVIWFWSLGSLSAITVVLVSFWVAPSRKYLVANLTYIVGVLISLLIIVNSISTVGVGPFGHCSISAIISGGLTFLYLKRKSNITSSKTNASQADSDVA